jgi:transcriptional regulator with XRE-family HTH domain
MAPGHVSYGLRAQYGLHVTPDTVISWERGIGSPDARELTALAGVLWCAPKELLNTATTWKEHREIRGISADDLARALGMTPAAYARMEESGRWQGNEKQAELLARALELRPRELLVATGQDALLVQLLRNAVTGRWQAYSKPLAKLVPLLDRGLLSAVLEDLHSAYRAASLSPDSGESDRAFLELIADHFWARTDPRG